MAISAWYERARIKIRQHFPQIPKSRREIYPRAIGFGILLVAMLIALLMEPSGRMVSLEVLWLQLAGATILWLESNADVSRVDLVVSEFQKIPIPPTTRAERIVNAYVVGFSILLPVLGIVAVALEVWVKAAPQGTHVLIVGELKVLAFAIVVFVVIWGCGKWFDSQSAKLARRLKEAGAQNQQEQRDIARRALRTQGFALVAVATAIQMAQALAS